MTPFDINPDNDAGHTIDQDDLIAFHLHDLPSPQERAIRRVLHNRPDLQAESIAIASTLRAFPKHEPAPSLDAAALDRNWQTLRNSLQPYTPPPAVPFSFFPRWAFPTLAASALVATVLVVSLRHTPDTKPYNLASNPSPASTITASPASNPTSQFAPSSEPSTVSPSSNTGILHHLEPAARHPSASQPPIPFPPTTMPPTQPSSSTGASLYHSPEASPAPAISASTEHSSPLPVHSPQTPLPQPPSIMQLSRVRAPRFHNARFTDVTLAVFGNLTVSNSSASGTAAYTQSTTPAIGVLASFHQQLRPWLGYRITATRSEPTFQYAYQVPTAYSSGSVTSTAGNTVYEHAYELAGTYVVQGPHRRRISTSAEAGAGLLAFLPPGTNIGNPPLINAYRPEAVAGVSAELVLTRHLALHAGYRALLYKAPASYYGTSYGVAVPSDPGNLTLSSEPVLGLTYRFRPISAE